MASQNHSEIELLSAEEAMPRMAQDTPSQQATRSVIANRVRSRLTIDADEMNYASRDTVVIEWQAYGEWHSQEFPIRSLDDTEMAQILSNNRLDAPEFPMVWDENLKQPVRDTNSPEFINYIGKFTALQQSIRMEKFLMAFDGGEILERGTKRVVWDSDDPTIRDREAALKTLFALQIPPHQMQIISDAIDGLSVKKSLTSTENSTNGQPLS